MKSTFSSVLFPARSARISQPPRGTIVPRALALATLALGLSVIHPQAIAASFLYTGSLNTARHGHTATLLPNGMVLVAGGLGSSGPLTSAELYNPPTGTRYYRIRSPQ